MRLVVPCLAGSVTGYSVFGGALGFGWNLVDARARHGVLGVALGPVFGYGPMFGTQQLGPFVRVADLLPLAVLGILCGLLGRAFIYSYHGVNRLLRPWRAHRLWALPTAAGAGVLVGLAGMWLPEILGTGYGTVQMQMSQAVLLAAPIWLLALVPLLKILATSATLGAGGVGGVFGPAMVIGASAGALVWRCAEAWHLAPGPAALYVVAGVAACLGPAVRARLATTVIAVELVHAIFPPLGMVLAVGCAVPVFGRSGLFPSLGRHGLGYPCLSVVGALR
jgi:CIC family chloride channel protein